MRFFRSSLISLAILASARIALAGVEGSISGTVTDTQGIPVPNVSIQLQKLDGTLIKETASGPAGDYMIFPVKLGDYQLSAKALGFGGYMANVHVASGANTTADVQLGPPVQGKEIILNVHAKRKLVQSSAPTTSTEITAKQIEKLPQGENIKLSTLLETTVPGVVPGPFGQIFVRGNHANVQYQIDGVQLPDSPSNTFGEAFTPRNIDTMEVITGGIPPEFGNRLAAVVNIVTKSGPETPGGEAELNYGSYNTFSPWMTYGGSNVAGDVHYFLSAQYTRTDRGLDTPQPDTESYNLHGGTDAIHDASNGNNTFAKIDWLVDNTNKLSFIGFNSYNYFEIPNYPASFGKQGGFFSPSHIDDWGDGPFNYAPSNTNDTQAEDNAYVEAVWKHSFTDHSFLMFAPYYKYSLIHVTNDLTNDLDAANNTANGPLIPGSNPSSFAENRHVNNFGLKSDFSDRINNHHFLKTGFQLQESRAVGSINVTSQCAAGGTCTPGTYSSLDDTPTNGIQESLYAQDEFTIARPLTLLAGVRYDATQFHFHAVNSADYLIQPRLGLTYLPTETTKLHFSVGRLFMPAPTEDLRDTFVGTGATPNTVIPYDIKAEKDWFYEFGVAQQVQTHVVNMNIYYKTATDMLDDSQLLNTSIAQPYNFTRGYAYGVELSVSGKINNDWSDYANYSYEIARAQGISGGLFSVGNAVPSDWYTYLDHVQVSTANAGVMYGKDNWYWTTQTLYGSGLRTGFANTESLPAHLTFDTTIGYDFHGDTWWKKAKVSVDVLNITNNAYPISIANGFNGSHYAPGREFFMHLTKEL